MRIAAGAAIVVLAVGISACSSGPDTRYLDTRVGAQLELPPDLSDADVGSRFELPAAFITGEDESRNQVPVLPRVKSLRLAGASEFYWLEVEEPVANLYRLVKDFWAAEGFRLIVDEPVIGTMLTEWVYKKEGGSGESESWIDKLFGSSGLTATQDQFKTRIERNGQDGAGRIYIVHRGTEYSPELTVSTVGSDEPLEDQWRHRQSEPELEIEMLSRLMLYLGLNKNEAAEQQTRVKLFKPRASLEFDAKENVPYLMMNDSYSIAWNRVYHNLERLNFDILEADLGGGVFSSGSIVVDAGIAPEEQKGGFFSFLSSDEPKQRRFSLVFSEESHILTRVDIEGKGGEADSSAEAAEFMNLLYRQIR